MKSLTDQLTAARRELGLRKNAYPRWLSEGRAGWTADKVRHEIECMEAIVGTLEKCAELEQVGSEFRLEFPEGKSASSAAARVAMLNHPEGKKAGEA